MDLLSIKDIQQVSMDILIEVHNFCVQHQIRYSLAYGTLIGAIRHKGFIPWDDDIDIIMPRLDYERFCNSFQAKGLGILPETDGRSYINFCRICDTLHTKCSTDLPFAKKYTWGVWIDVFPIDGVTDDRAVFCQEANAMTKLWEKQIILRRSLPSLRKIYEDSLHNDKVENKFKNILIFALMKGSLLAPVGLRIIKKRLRNKARQIPFASTGHWSQLACLDDPTHDYQLIDDFKTVFLMPFENQEFYVMNGFDRVLKNLYGDYKKLPPEDQRISHSESFYWASK